jgi:beta-phosphoglucomutase
MAASRTASGARVRAIVLDFNGTLAQDDHLVAPLYVDAFASIGATLTAEEYHRDLAALPDREVFELGLQRARLPVDPIRRDALVQARLEGYMAAVAETPPIAAHAVAFVRAAAGRVHLAIASGAFRREIESVLDAAALSAYFEAIVAIDDVTHGKPHPEGFLRALEEINRTSGELQPITAAEVVAVEDATAGAYAARQAGMHVAAIRGPGYDPLSGHAELIIERLDPAALEQMLVLADPVS